MLNKSKLTLAFVPARGGSKGIYKKNLALLNNKPLIQYTLDLCSKNLHVDDTMVSSDDSDILDYVSKLGFSKEYLRPSNIASDESSIVDAVIDGVNWYEKKHKKIVSVVVLLQPTSPIRKQSEINKAIDFFRKNKLQSIFSVIKMREAPYECIEITNQNIEWIYLRNPPKLNSRRQDYKGTFGFIDGSFYIATMNFLREHRSFIKKSISKPFFLKYNAQIDVDTEYDLEIVNKNIYRSNK